MKSIKAALLTACLFSLSFNPAMAESAYPNRPVKLIVPAPPGTGPDVMARLYAEQLGRRFDQQFTVENRAGATGNIGAEAAAKAPGDGYTLLYAFNQIATINPHLFNKLTYDVQKDLLPVSLTLTTGYILLASNKFQANNLADVISLAKQSPGKIPFASYGSGTAAHLAFELIQDETNTRFLHVPYKQGAVADVMGGQVSMLFEPFTSAVPFAKSGKLKALAVTTSKRLAELPSVPTLAETLPGFELVGWQGIWAPVGTPTDIINRLQSEISKISQSPEMQKRIRELGSEPVGSTPQEMARTITTESARWGALIKAKNIHLD